MTIDTQINHLTAPTSSNTICAKDVPLLENKSEKNENKKTTENIKPHNFSLLEQSKIAKALIDTKAEQLNTIEGELTIDNVIKHIFGECNFTQANQSATPRKSTPKKINALIYRNRY